MNPFNTQLSTGRRSLLTSLFTVAVLIIVILLVAPGELSQIKSNGLAAACSSGAFGFQSTCSNTTYSGDGCTTTTVCKKKWWGFGGNKCSTSTYCPAPVANSSDASVASVPPTGTQLQSCPAAYPQLCGGTSCIPSGAVCCSTVGYADRFCNAGSFCTIGGQCEATSGGQYCNANYNQACTSSTNSCGMSNSGFYSCTGTCQATVPADSSCASPDITVTKFPTPFVNAGDTCRLTWTVTHATSCTLTDISTGSVVGSGISGTYTSPAITQQRDYRMNCKNGSVVAASSNVSCLINPAFNEN